jgi:hypothetical protein
MTSQRLEGRIRKLCEEALKAEEGELECLFQELRALLHQHNELVRKLVTEGLRHSPPVPDSLSRKRNGH